MFVFTAAFAVRMITNQLNLWHLVGMFLFCLLLTGCSTKVQISQTDRALFPAAVDLGLLKTNYSKIVEGGAEFDEIIAYSSSNPASKIIVEGYTDSLGHPVYNKNLSKMRAEVIKKHLVEKGIPAEKIKTVGMGPENPIAGNETFEGRKLNRRIEISLKLKE